MKKDVLKLRKLKILKSLIEELRQLTDSKVVLQEKRDLSNTTLLKTYIESLLRKFKIKERVEVRNNINFVVVDNKNPSYDASVFNVLVNYLIDKKDFVKEGNKMLNQRSFCVLREPDSKVFVLIENESKNKKAKLKDKQKDTKKEKKSVKPNSKKKTKK